MTRVLAALRPTVRRPEACVEKEEEGLKDEADLAALISAVQRTSRPRPDRAQTIRRAVVEHLLGTCSPSLITFLVQGKKLDGPTNLSILELRPEKKYCVSFRILAI